MKNKNILDVINSILDIEPSIVGEEYLKTLIKNISLNLNVKYVFIGHPTSDDLTQVQTDLVWANGKFIDNFIYDLKNTPCELVLSGKRVCIHDKCVTKEFPDDLLLQEMGIESYVGAPIVSSLNSKVSNILVLLDDKPMENREFYTSLTEFFALRAGTENKIISIDKDLQEKTKQFEEKEKQFEDIIENINDFVWEVDTNGIYTYASPQVKHILGYEPNEILGKSPFELMIEDDKKRLQKDFEQLLLKREKLEQLQNINLHKNGHIVYLETSGVPIFTKKGEFKGYRGTDRDITKRIESEQKLQANHLQIQQLNKDLKNTLEKVNEEVHNFFDISITCLIIVNLKGEIVKINAAWEKTLGYKKEELIGKLFIDWIHPDDIDATNIEMSKLVNGKNVYNFHNRYKHKDGHYITFSWSATTNEDKTLIYASAQDISEVQRKDQLIFQQSKHASMGEMLGNIAHQWRQPLSVISVAATGIKLKQNLNLLQDDELISGMDTINDSAQYLSNVIDTFLNFFRGKKEFQEISIKEIFKNTLFMLENTLKKHEINILSNIEKIEDFNIITIPSELQQVLINILNNAIDAFKTIDIENKNIVIKIKKNTTTLDIKITDNAGGIPENIIKNIFEAYFTTKDKSQGTGLGLHMSYRIVTESFKGKIFAENDKDGASFTLTLPINVK